MPNFYGIEYDIPLNYYSIIDGYVFETEIVTDEDFHNALYAATEMLMKCKKQRILFRSPNDYTHLNLELDNDNRYEFTIEKVIPLIDKSIIRTIIDIKTEKLTKKLSYYADLAGLNNSTKSARNV